MTRRWFIVVLLLTCAAGMVAVNAGPDEAGAMEPVGASLSLAVDEPAGDASTRTVAVAVEPGDSGLVALTASLVYDPAAVQVLSCAVSEAGACNDLGGLVKFTVFSLTGLDTNSRLLTVEIAPGDGSTIGTMSLVSEMAIGGPDDEVIDVALPATDAGSTDDGAESDGSGSLTGDVIAAEDETGLYAIDVCASHAATDHTTCTTTNGWGAWRIDDLAEGDYSIEVSDPSAKLGPTVIDASVTDDRITTGLDAALASAGTDEQLATDPAAEPVPQPVQQTSKPVVFEASISGVARAMATNQALPGVQVCATQPLVLHQRCATSGADGSFVLEGLSTGNYWLTAVDPLGRAGDARSRLVGVVGDRSHRTGVVVSLPPR